MVHSGSRNLGFQVANHYNKRAISLNKQWKSEVPSSWQLAYLPIQSEDGQSYFREMNYCLDFARANRMVMCKRIEEALLENVSDEIDFKQPIHIAHNYAAREKHFGKEVYIHRKGATRSEADEKGIIPGSQGSASYIVSGRGNPESFYSCSHGAGRKIGENRRSCNWIWTRKSDGWIKRTSCMPSGGARIWKRQRELTRISRR